MGNGEVFQSTLDGTTATPPHEVFFPVVKGLEKKDVYCDGLDTLNGYVDSRGTPPRRFIASIWRRAGQPGLCARVVPLNGGRAAGALVTESEGGLT